MLTFKAVYGSDTTAHPAEVWKSHCAKYPLPVKSGIRPGTWRNVIKLWLMEHPFVVNGQRLHGAFVVDPHTRLIVAFHIEPESSAGRTVSSCISSCLIEAALDAEDPYGLSDFMMLSEWSAPTLPTSSDDVGRRVSFETIVKPDAEWTEATEMLTHMMQAICETSIFVWHVVEAARTAVARHNTLQAALAESSNPAWTQIPAHYRPPVIGAAWRLRPTAA